MIGGRNQTGNWKIDARYNTKELIGRITAIAKLSRKVSLTRKDAKVFLRQGKEKWSSDTLIYCDPPYFEKGRELYYDFYEASDHSEVAKLVTTEIVDQHWIVSYDNVKAINAPLQRLS